MKYINKYSILFFVAAMFFACEDEEIQKRNFPGWETAVNGFGQLQETSAANFLLADVVNGLDIDFRWISIDGTNTVEKIEFFITFEEGYTNKDGDPAVADHGTELFMTVDSPPDNRTDMSLNISQDDVYTLFQNATYDYMETGSAVSVWTYPPKARNVTTTPFVDGDSYVLTWIMTTTDGRVFDSWSPSACTELPGSNCQIAWILECGQEFNDPRGVYTLSMVDSYGDGWNGAFVTVDIDGSTTDYDVDTAPDGGDNAATGIAIINVPNGTTSVGFSFTGGAWDSEITFTITSEHGNTIASAGPSPEDGAITLNLCLENATPASVVP